MYIIFLSKILANLMSNIIKKIIAVGGGGFTHKSDPTLDQFILSQCNKTKIKFGFLPTASNDDPEKIKTFYNELKKYDLELSHFELCINTNGFSDWIFKNDIIYVGGGNTSEMLKIWNKNNLTSIFKKAYDNGIILSGVSAGAICWFDWSLTDSLGPNYKPLQGINLISGSCTPHSSEKNRLAKFKLEIKNQNLPSGIAIDDGVAVLFENGKAKELCLARKNCDAYFVDNNKKTSLKEYINYKNE